jgi:hypothetical protein
MTPSPRSRVPRLRFGRAASLRWGTDAQQGATNSADWLVAQGGLPRLLGAFWGRVLPRQRRIGVFGARGDYPAGTGHAVPRGEAVALCGLMPAFLWQGAFKPRSRILTPCGRCVQLAADIG